MTYTKQTWADSPATSSPISAARLGHLEDGIEAAHNLPGLLRLGTFTNAPNLAAPGITDLIVDGVFIPAHTRYRLVWDARNLDASLSLKFSLRAGGVEEGTNVASTKYATLSTGFEYLASGLNDTQFIDAMLATYRWNFGRVGMDSSGWADVFFPATARRKTMNGSAQWTSAATDMSTDGSIASVTMSGVMYSTAVFDGFRLYSSADPTEITVAVYAYV